MSKKSINKHAAVDERIKDLIACGAVHFYQIKNQLGDLPFRLIDRRLQAMKKSGQIVYKGQSWGWRITKSHWLTLFNDDAERE